MSTKVAGYGRYKDDPNHVGCPRAHSDMTPCIARDGALALADDGVCVGCGSLATVLLVELRVELGYRKSAPLIEKTAADLLTGLVRIATAP